VAGSQIKFTEHCEHDLKGVPGRSTFVSQRAVVDAPGIRRIEIT